MALIIKLNDINLFIWVYIEGSIYKKYKNHIKYDYK
jgi:hypothetical protein